uniref:Uncharacterized protein n=1 Tax=Romanomermis culicivorax TaxID=13658 RepID=A0A915HRZ3_ROMCU
MQLCQNDNSASQTGSLQQPPVQTVATQQSVSIQRDTSLDNAGLSLDQFCTSYKDKFDSICT